MSPRSERHRLQDIKDAIARVRLYAVSGLEELQKQELVWDGILFNFAVIGEAVKDLSTETLARTSYDWGPVAKMRDFVIHHYFATDPQVVWETIKGDLPELEAAIDELLGPTAN